MHAFEPTTGEHAEDCSCKPSQLTPREVEVLQAAANGEGVNFAAWRLKISPGTVKVYRASICRKYGVHRITEAAAIALRAGVIQ
jgi:two-component system, NarL family, response regulator DesR